MGIHFPDPTKLIKKIEHGAKDALHQVEHAEHTAERTITGACTKALHEVEGASQQALHQIEGATQKAMRTLEHTAQHAAEELLATVSAQALRKALTIAEALAPDQFTLQIGPVVLEIDHIASRVEALRKWAGHPPANPAQIRSLIQDLAPTTCGIQVSAEFALLFVSSESLSVGVAASWTTEAFLERFNQILHDL